MSKAMSCVAEDYPPQRERVPGSGDAQLPEPGCLAFLSATAADAAAQHAPRFQRSTAAKVARSAGQANVVGQTGHQPILQK